jgi:hypothetical protein|tara:strand:+ start:5226 stop:7031 length:1806 start_codon:yes stop_codon:yes gene_type:complete
MAYEITEQDKALLNLVAKHEAKSYDTIYGGREVPLRQMLIAEVLDYQRNVMGRFTACGRYQMLRAVIDENCRKLNMDPTQVRLTEDVQDIMMIDKITRMRKYGKWKSGSLSENPDPVLKTIENSQIFMIYMAAEWASVPVPYTVPAGSIYKGHPRRSLNKGQSFYAGDGVNKAHHDADEFLSSLVDIYNGGSGEVTTIVEVPAGGGTPTPTASAPAGSTGYQQAGTSAQSRIQNFASGGSRVTGNTGNASALAYPPQSDTTPYEYGVIDPLDDRYDFRTGKKVVRLLENSTNSVQQNAPGSINTPASDFGVAPNTLGVNPETFTDTEVTEQLNNRDAAATQAGRYSDNTNKPDTSSTVTEQSAQNNSASTTNTSGTSTTNSSISLPSQDGLSGTLAPYKKIPNPLDIDPTTLLPTGLGKSGIGSLLSSMSNIGFDPANIFKPGLNQTPLLQPAIQQSSSTQLQTSLDAKKYSINTTIGSMNDVYNNIPSSYKTELEIQQSTLNSQITNPGASATEVFALTNELAIVTNKISMGSPYGLTVNSVQTRTKQTANYQTYNNDLTAHLVDIDIIQEKARSSGTDLKFAKYDVDRRSVPPVVTFKD